MHCRCSAQKEKLRPRKSPSTTMDFPAMTMALFPETLFRMMEKQNNELEKGGNFWNLFGRKEKRGSNVEKRGNIYRRGLNPFKGEIAVLAFTFCPTGWAATNGELLPIQANAALFSLIGTKCVHYFFYSVVCAYS